MKASLFTPLTLMDSTLNILAIRDQAPKNVLLPKLLLESYIGSLINATVGNSAPNRWRIGVGSPITGLGSNGDLYLNTTTSDIYGPKTGGLWGSSVGNLKGSTGNIGSPGSKWFIGTGVPSGGVGAISDLYIDSSQGSIYGPKAVSGWGSVSGNIKGPTGNDGNTWVTGNGVPDPGTGNNGWLYLDLDTGNTYGPKTNSNWGGVTGNLKGTDGVVGTAWITGPIPPTNGQGIDGDLYLNTTNGDIYGPKTGGLWGASSSNIKGITGDNGIDGTVWLFNVGAPSTGLGLNGNMYFDTTTGDVYGPKNAGVWGPIASSLKGPDGTNGSVWFAGTAVPGDILGIDGDYYLRTTNSDIYGPKAAGTWGTPSLNIKGTSGNDGTSGTIWRLGSGVPSIEIGVNGDFYLRTSTYDIYGPKASGVWGGVIGNLRGADGTNGIDGIDGTNGVNGSLIYSGSATPDNGTGVNGDYYIRSNGDFYGPKAAGTWGAVAFSIKGAPGDVTNGGGVATIRKISQVDYDALSPPDANTLYIIE